MTIQQITVLEGVLRQEPGAPGYNATVRMVAEKIRAKIGYREPVTDHAQFLVDFYTALRSQQEPASMDPFRSEGDVATLGMNRKHCFACAAILDIRAELCPKCGVRQPILQQQLGTAMVFGAPTAITHTSKNRTTAGLFALLLGGIGIHKFYLGQTGIGVLYAIFCWTLIPSLIALVEGILLLTMSDQDFARKFPG